ncbi:hypothetical protein KBX50_05225 [Micromonospora sp. C51]|uniref:hypothetical protein n=1 Tax=Micromonospora sp. C51 TaxID=2824879 RepID=UPI001B377AC6|nr:hypothetical protein [Micromonospora sp. C51]MBQ1047860.1 hypothetical protein [Micromonospora sp. C51]
MAKPKRLATTVYVAGRAWGPADDVPAEVAELITNPKAWATDDEPEPKEAKTRKAGTRAGVRLASTVHVGGRSYGPDDEVPDDVARRVTNPKAWEGGKAPFTAEGGVVYGPGSQPVDRTNPQATREYAMTPDEVAAATDGDGDGDGAIKVPAPPRAGKGSGADAWAAFAATQGVQVDEGASRDEIIAACEQAGVIEPAGQ